MKKFILFLVNVFIFISLVNALSCSTNQIVRNIQSGTALTQETITCSNTDNFSINVFKSGNFFTTNPSSITIQPNSSQAIIISFEQLGLGYYSGFLYSSDGLNIPINVNITEKIIDTGGIIVFPTAKVVNVQQGQIKNQNIQIIVPSSYPRNIVIQSINFNPDIDVLKFDDLNLGILNPGSTLNIPIIIDARNVQTGTYSSQINILATDSNGQIQLPSVNMQVIVSVGINPITNGTFIKPSCSLSSTTFNMNNTYTFVCTNAVENIEISPEYNEYLEGIKADYSAGVYTYTFRAIKQGNSQFKSTFQYKSSPVFSAFISDFKVTPSGVSSVGGIFLKAEFYQKGIKREINDLMSENTFILVIDNLTGNLVSPFEIYLNGIKHNQTSINLRADETYDLRLTAEGYNNLIINNISVKQSQLSLIINPNKDKYFINDIINISSNTENFSILVNNYIASNPYVISQSGNLTIEVKKEGFRSINKTIYVSPSIYLSSCTPIKTDWEKGNSVICVLSEKAKWEVYFNNQVIASGENDKVEFKINEFGDFFINANGLQIDSASIFKINHWYNPFSWDFSYIKSNWIAFGIFILVIAGIGFIMFRNGRITENLTPYS